MFCVVAWPPNAALQRCCKPVARLQLQFQEVHDCSDDPSSRFRLVNGGLVDLDRRGQRCVETDLHDCTLLRTPIGSCHALQQSSGFQMVDPWPARVAGRLLEAAYWQQSCDQFVVLRTYASAPTLVLSARLTGRLSFQKQERSVLPHPLEFQEIFLIRSRPSFVSDVLLLKLAQSHWAVLRLGWNEILYFSEPSRLLGIHQSSEHVGSNPRHCYVLCYLVLVLDCSWPILHALLYDHQHLLSCALKRDLWLVFEDKSFAVAV
jgi:hypothetical protein